MSNEKLTVCNGNDNSNYHLGHIFMDIMMKRPESVCQINAATGEKETRGSVLARSIKLARCFRKFGLKPGDVLALGGNNHLDLYIPFYAALLNGLPIVGVDPYFKYEEIKKLFKLTEPKVAFCQYESYQFYVQAANDLQLDTKIITFDKGECAMSMFMETYGEESTDEFRPATFDTNKVYAWLVSTSGTTGFPKLAAFKHGSVLKAMQGVAELAKLNNSHNGSNNEIILHLTPVQWVSSYLGALSIPATNKCKLSTSSPVNTNDIIDIINQYKPGHIITNSLLFYHLLKAEKECDLTCFDSVFITGGRVYKDVITQLKAKMRPNTTLLEMYGFTESLGPALIPEPNGPVGSCGRPLPSVTVKLVDTETGADVTKPNIPGELWYKGPGFSEYYNNPEETANAFSEDGWFKSGDLLYRDENDNFYFVERLRILIKCRHHVQVAPPELEEVISRHKDVLDVGVTSILDHEEGEKPVACVVRRPGSQITDQEIKDIVINNLSINKQLRTVMFVDKLPITSTGKLARGKLKEMALQLNGFI